jgi:biopolymer transport protein ExbD
MSRRRKKKRHMSDVELNLAAMLDMAFQLLCFFILTFKPAPVEGDIILKLPPPMPTTMQPGAKPLGGDESDTSPVMALETLTISVLSTPSGSIKAIMVGDAEVPGALAGLDFKLKKVLGESNAGFKQVLIQVDSRLHYDSLMQIIGVCNVQKIDGERLSKLSFVELPMGAVN